MNKTFYDVNVQYVGVGQADSRDLCIMPTPSDDTISVTIAPVAAAGSTFVARLQYANTPQGPWSDYDTPVTLGPADLSSGLRAVLGMFAAFVVSTGEGATIRYNVSFQSRKQGGVAAGV